MPVVAVTGASGFIGSHVVRRLTERGWRVLALVRDPSASVPPGAEIVAYELAGPPPRLEGVDWLVHAAYVPGTEEVNIAGARRLVEAAREQAVGATLFVSSLAAQPSAASAYGRQKLACEPLFDVALRPGLVLGDGGLLRRTVEFMRRWRAAPLIDGGRQPLQTIAVDDVAAAIERIIRDDLRGVFTVADPRPTTYRDVYAAIARAAGLRVRFISVPYRALELALRGAGRLRLPVPVGADNLRGLRSARYVDGTADLARLGLRPRCLDDVLRALLAPR